MNLHYLNKILIILFQSFLKIGKVFKLAMYTSVYDNGCSFKTSPKIVILGSSFAMTNIIPKQISKINPSYAENEILNFGQSTAGPYSMYITLKKNWHKMNNLEYVYIGLDPHILGEKFYHYMKVEKQLMGFKQWEYMFKNHSEYMKKYHSGLQLNIFLFLNSVKSMFTNICKKKKIFNGYEPRFHKFLKESNMKDIAKYTYEPIELFPPSIFEIKYLQRIQKLLMQNKSIKIRYFLSPSFDWYEGYEKNCLVYDGMLVSLLNQYLGKVVLLGSLDKRGFNFNEYDFYDNRHLSHTGALKFTDIVFRDINKQKQSRKILPLSNYKIQTEGHPLKIDSLNINMLKYQKLLLKFLAKDTDVVLFGLTNFSRCVMYLIEDNFNSCKIFDQSSYLKSAPEYLRDDFIFDKDMDHVSNLQYAKYDVIFICNYLEYDVQKELLKRYNISDEKLYLADIKNEEFDYKYFHLQINILFNILDYIIQKYSIVYVTETSHLISFASKVIWKKVKVVYLVYDINIDNINVKNSLYLCSENSTHILRNMENVIVLQI